MGTYNKIIIPSMNLIIDTKVDDDTDYFNENFDNLIDSDNWVDFNNELGEKTKFSVLDEAKIVINQNKLNEVVCDVYVNDKLFLWWLMKKGISFEILSENSKEYETIDKKGYVFL